MRMKPACTVKLVQDCVRYPFFLRGGSLSRLNSRLFMARQNSQPSDGRRFELSAWVRTFPSRVIRPSDVDLVVAPIA